MQLKEKIAAYKQKLEEERKEVCMNRLEAMKIDPKTSCYNRRVWRRRRRRTSPGRNIGIESRRQGLHVLRAIAVDPISQYLRSKKSGNDLKGNPKGDDRGVQHARQESASKQRSERR